MAKKRKKKEVEAEKYEFKPPDFDEKKFLEDEMKATKRVLITVIYGALFGVLTASMTITTENAALGLLMLIIGLISLKYILPLLGIDLSIFTKKTWLESGAWFFFTFMALWILMYNPPFGDHANPDIEDVSVWIKEEGKDWLQFNYTWDDRNQTHYFKDAYDQKLNDWQPIGNITAVNITARVIDISGLEGQPMITVGTRSPTEMATVDDYYYEYLITIFDSSYLKGVYFTFSILAEDTAGNNVNFILDPSAEVVWPQ